MTSLPTENVGEAYLAILRHRGVENLFVNAGTDFPPIVEAYSRARDTKLDLPRPVVASHENLAVGMAHGAYLVTGQPQAVMVHVSVGTANTLCGMINAAHDRVPILLSAGRTPLYEADVFGSRSSQIHWAQEMFDQAGMLRELVKWDYELRSVEQLEEVVDRALTVAMAEPRGPVYLSLPREVLSQPVPGVDLSAVGLAQPSEPAPSRDAVEQLADLIAGAQLPVIVVASTGSDQVTFATLGDLSLRYSVGVLESRPRYVNVDGGHPLHIGYRIGAALEEADVLCFLDCDVPWIPAHGQPRDDATVVQCGVDPLFSRYPMRSHRSDLTITATPRQLLEHLDQALSHRVGAIPPDRRGRITALAVTERDRDDAVVAADAARGGAITKTFMSQCLAQARPDDSIVVNEYWAQARVLRPTVPGTFFDFPLAGGLGWGLPAALGVQLAAPDRVVIAAVGDGAYLLANPAACHHAATMHNLPLLTIVCNNGRWAAVEEATRYLYAEGHAASSGYTGLSDLRPMPDLACYAQASGGFAETVVAHADLLPALRRSFDVVREERRQALVNVVCE